jgi:hypothetical protein
MSEILVIPETLRAKLGDDGAKDLVELINQSYKNLKDNFNETASGRLEQRLAETKADLGKQIGEVKQQIAEVRADIIKWMFVFWAGQLTLMVGLLGLFYKLLK